MAGESITVGDIKIISLTDGGNEADLGEFFPHHGPEDWTGFPDYVDEAGRYRTPVNLGSYLVVSGEQKVLVDTGIGSVPFAPYPDLTGDMVPTMRDQCGYGPEDVDLVFATHMHFDHIGWHVTRPDGPDGDPVATFPNAKYVMPKTDWDSILDPALPKAGPHAHDFSQAAADIFNLSRPLADDLMPVVDVQTITGDEALTPDIQTVDTPGHTPGHQSLLISSGGERVFLMGDAIHLPVQMEAGPGGGRGRASATGDQDAHRDYRVARKRGSDDDHRPLPGAWLRPRGPRRRQALLAGDLTALADYVGEAG